MIGISARPVGSFQTNLHLFLVKPRALDVSSRGPLRHAMTGLWFPLSAEDRSFSKSIRNRV